MESPAAESNRPLVFAGIALVVAVLAALWFDRISATLPAETASVLALAVTWVPLGASIVLIIVSRGWRASSRAFGLRIRPLDLLWGIGIGCIARVVGGLVDQAFYGTTGLSRQPMIVSHVGVWFIFTGLVAPVILAPLIEEVFFRGILQSMLSLRMSNAVSPLAATAIAVAITSIAFSLVHLVGVTSAVDAEATVITLLIFGAAVGALAAATGRIGGALIAHVVFNGIVVALTWPS